MAATLRNYLSALDFNTKKSFFKILILTFFMVSCAEQEPFRIDFALGTVCTVTLYDQGQNRVYNDIFSRIYEIENLMSVNIPSSDISRINAVAGIMPVQVHEDTFKVIERAVYYAGLSGGAFDPTVGPLVSLWDIGGQNQRIPSQNEIEEALPLVNWRNIELNPSSRSVFLKRAGMALDLGSIAKGYAADEAVKVITKTGIKRALIDLGGNIVTFGIKKDRSPWRVGIQNPLSQRGAVIGYVQITQPLSTVVTSGVYERSFEENGIRYHHLFSPERGYPVQNGLLSVTLITDVSMDADALSTAVFVLGYERGMALLDSLPETEAVFVFEDLSILTTPGANFTLIDGTFRPGI